MKDRKAHWKEAKYYGIYPDQEPHAMTAMKELNEKGQCPMCKIKPLVYKRESKKFCWRCDREYSLDTGQQVKNFAYDSDGKKVCHDSR